MKCPKGIPDYTSFFSAKAIVLHTCVKPFDDRSNREMESSGQKGSRVNGHISTNLYVM